MLAAFAQLITNGREECVRNEDQTLGIGDHIIDEVGRSVQSFGWRRRKNAPLVFTTRPLPKQHRISTKTNFDGFAIELRIIAECFDTDAIQKREQSFVG